MGDESLILAGSSLMQTICKFVYLTSAYRIIYYIILARIVLRICIVLGDRLCRPFENAMQLILCICRFMTRLREISHR